MKNLSYNSNHLRRFLGTHKLLFMFVFLVFIAGGTHQFLRWHVQDTYESLVGNQEFLGVFAHGDEKNIATLADRMGFSYMRFSHDSVTYKSDPTLPTPRLVTFLQHPLASVLEENLGDRLFHMRPYVTAVGLKLYIMFPVELDTKPQEGYLIYRRVFP